ncbi:Protein-tyrosine-phosphatase [Dehalogenimonas formicexedens]|uniref:Protein-tyrosine-phosphatase n=2 Tax=Dehalogenimonas formicexedens TaxID=1839801 RepID=A0A1P8F914_9CHLR|nr:Protein-tyrosine-phosphatase [Dehalogenimonas formicexedens]
MAEAFFNRYAHGEAVAESAGTEPGDAVNPVVVAAMKELGFDLSQSLLQALTAEMTRDVARTVTMGCLDDACPLVSGPQEDWALPDPKGKDLAAVRKIRDDIKNRVLALIEDLGIKSGI